MSSQVIVMACREFEMGRVSVQIFAHVKSQLLFFFLIKKNVCGKRRCEFTLITYFELYIACTYGYSKHIISHLYLSPSMFYMSH